MDMAGVVVAVAQTATRCTVLRCEVVRIPRSTRTRRQKLGQEVQRLIAVFYLGGVGRCLMSAPFVLLTRCSPSLG